MKKVFSLAIAALIIGSPAASQVASIGSSTAGHWRPPPKSAHSQDLTKVECFVFETTGTRLGARKVCKTALEWQQLQSEHRETLEKVQQMGTGVPVSG